MHIEEYDKNLVVDKEIDKSGLKFYSFESEPFKIYGGLSRGEDGMLYRVPREVAENTNPGVLGRCTNTSGGRVKFRTDSKRVAIIAKYAKTSVMSHFPATGSVGLDVYVNNIYEGTFVPPKDMPNKAYESLLDIPQSGGEQDIMINLPLYSSLTDLYIGLDEGATLSAPTPYKHERPIVYYGSSITQGGCASRPGNTYEARISRYFDWNFINLGFSGAAKGEAAIVEHIASLDMSVFVCDYDHNAPSPDHLKATHLPLYRTVRAKHPELPIVFMTRPNKVLRAGRLPRREIIKNTYDIAVSEGDKNVYFLDPTENLPVLFDEGTVDYTHPSDLGFYFMANALLPIISEIEKKLYGKEDE